MEMHCPGCRRPMVEESHHGIQIDACPGCQGMWFDHGELVVYWRASRSVEDPPAVDPSRFEAAPGAERLRCPRCQTETVVAQRIGVFRGGPCSACLGVWLSPSQVGGFAGSRGPDVGIDSVTETVGLAMELVAGIFDL